MNWNIIISFIIITFITSCAQQEKKISALDSNEPPLEGGQQMIAKSQLADVPQHDLYSDGKTKLIKTANYRFEVDNVKKSTESIHASVKKFPAYISSSNLRLENPILESKMTIRVQNEYFNDMLQEIDGQTKFVNHRDVSTADVSKEFVDLESRLKTKREVEARYIEILRKKAGTIEELLNAEEQIGELHEEIEATISRINYLREQVSYSTINLEFYQTVAQEVHATNENPIGDQFKQGLLTGWHGVVAIGIILTYIWPLLIITAVLALYLAWKKKRNSLVQ
jgi:DNA repair exonuclease SbcCD ATPase subunit